MTRGGASNHLNDRHNNHSLTRACMSPLLVFWLTNQRCSASPTFSRDGPSRKIRSLLGQSKIGTFHVLITERDHLRRNNHELSLAYSSCSSLSPNDTDRNSTATIFRWHELRTFTGNPDLSCYPCEERYQMASEASSASN